MNAQFEVPTHPTFGAILTANTIERGLVNVAKCRQMLTAQKRPRREQANVRMADAKIELEGGGKAVEYKAHLRQLRVEGLI